MKRWTWSRLFDRLPKGQGASESRQSEILRKSIPVPECGCWLWLGSTTNRGYGSVNGTRSHAHRIAYIAFRGPVADHLFVCHRCDTPSCVNPDHLFLGTNRDNVLDMVSKGRQWLQSRPQLGEAHNCAKLTEADVIKIRAEYAADGRRGRLTQIAGKFGVTRTQVGYIVRRKNWTHV